MILVVHAKPNARETKVVAWLDESTVVIAIHAVPDGGEANEELVDFLSEKLDIPKSFILLKSGLSGRVKRVEIPDGTPLSKLKPSLNAT